MAISAFATGVTWRIMYVQDPNLGAVNALGRVVVDVVQPAGRRSRTPCRRRPPSPGSAATGMVLKTPLHPGGVALLGLTGIPPDGVPAGAKQAVEPKPGPGHIAGVVWRDFKPGGGVPGQGRDGRARPARRDRAAAQQRGQGGEDRGVGRRRQLRLRGACTPGTYHAGISAQTFAKPWAGYAWLGTKLITPALIIAYIWIWAGFSMVVIAAGLSAMPRDVLEAARTDGASEWQVFRRVTVPLLAPVLSVVFITMIINVLKVFDLVITLAPGLVAERRQRDRARDVAHVVRRHQRLRRRLGDRRLPLRPRRAGAAPEHQALPEGGLRHESTSRCRKPKLTERDTVAREGAALPDAGAGQPPADRARRCSG